MTDIVGEDLPMACPFCGGKLAISHEPPSVMHSMPMCRTFQRYEPNVFLRKVRKALARAKSPGGN